tara:strand:+ start:60471 stop:60845 length:375 start_codon:yes stop_codon:yes gene_type:complete
MKKSDYIEQIFHPRLMLSSPIPIEISGYEGDFYGKWTEGNIEAEGKTEDDLRKDFQTAIVETYLKLRDKVYKAKRTTDEEEKQWEVLSYFIVEAVQHGAPTDERSSNVYAPVTPDGKKAGPFFG